jgi:hypothetical protein
MQYKPNRVGRRTCPSYSLQSDFLIKLLSKIADLALCNPRFVLSDANGSLLIRKVMGNQVAGAGTCAREWTGTDYWLRRDSVSQRPVPRILFRTFTCFLTFHRRIKTVAFDEIAPIMSEYLNCAKYRIL